MKKWVELNQLTFSIFSFFTNSVVSLVLGPLPYILCLWRV